MSTRGQLRITPWGASDDVEPVAPGVEFHSTPSHGGYLVDETAARRMSPAALAEAIADPSAGYWFEEDAAAAIVALELLELTPERRERALEVARHYFPAYAATLPAPFLSLF